ncbi:hypothetical protein NX059_011435 [Plenodomus lindquistii]|nr:hypothetical protein NX059_011435 [Plenodomus lindquistii]
MTELEALQQRCSEALRNDQDLKLRHLRSITKSDRLAEQRNVSEMEVYNATTAFAKASCKELTDRMHTLLPREIRDIIYKHLNPSSPAQVRTWKDDNWGGDIAVDLPQEYLGDREYVSKMFSIELREELYRNTCIDFADQLHDIASFRTKDEWTVGFAPVDFNLSIAVSVKCARYTFKNVIRRPRDWTALGVVPTEDLTTKLETLFGFKTGTKVAIKLLVTTGSLEPPLESDPWLCDEVLPFIFPTLRRLADAGTKVVVHFGNDGCTLPIHNAEVTLEDLRVLFEKVSDQETVQWSNLFKE